MLTDRRGQAAVLGIVLILTLIAVAAGLVDVYRLYAARNWAYSVAQEAALMGSSQGRDWSAVATSGVIRLDAQTALDAAQGVVAAEMASRNITTYAVDIRILTDEGGGSVSDYPPESVRLGSSRGTWSSAEPAVGVYLEVPVDWLILDTLGITEKNVCVFVAAGVSDA